MRRKPPSLFEKTSQTIFRNLQTWEGLIESLGDLRLEENELIQLVAIGSKRSIPEILQSQPSPKGLQLLSSSKALSLFEYHRRFGRDNRHRVAGQFVIAHPTSEPIYIFLFIAEPRFWREGILPLTDSLYPKAARPFLTQSELHRLLKNVQKAIQPQRLRVLEFSSKKRLTATARKRFQSVREWTDAEFYAVFREAEESNVWFRSVSFDLVAEQDGHVVSTGTHAKLSKYGYFCCNSKFQLFEKTIIRELIQIAAERLKFFSNRDRLSTPGHAPSPLQINYEFDVFKSTEQTKRLVEAMQRFKHGTCTVLHANPYVHLSVVDNIDYSSADLWVLSQNQILLVPQIRASEVALKRIVNHIFENFREGKISEFQEQ